jgi:hypothetical protein
VYTYSLNMFDSDLKMSPSYIPRKMGGFFNKGTGQRDVRLVHLRYIVFPFVYTIRGEREREGSQNKAEPKPDKHSVAWQTRPGGALHALR